MKILPFFILLALFCPGFSSNLTANSNSTSAGGGFSEWMSYFFQSTVPNNQTANSNDTTYNSSNSFLSFIVKNMKTTDLNSTTTTNTTSARLQALFSSFTDAFGITQTDREKLLDQNSTSNVTFINFLSGSVHLAPNITEAMENLAFVPKNISLDTFVSCTAPSLDWWCFQVKFFVVENSPKFKAKFIGETRYQCRSHNIPLKGTWEYYEPRGPYHIHAIMYHDCKYNFAWLKHEKKLIETDVAKFFENKTMTDLGKEYKDRNEIFTKFQLEDESERIETIAERYDAEFLEKLSAEKVDTLNILDARTDSSGAVTRKNYTLDARVRCSDNKRWCFVATLEAVPKDGSKKSKEVGRTKHRCTEENHVDILETFEHLELKEPYNIYFTLYDSCLNNNKSNGNRIRKLPTKLYTA